MKWTEAAIEDLRDYKGLQMSLKNITERIEALEAEFTGVKGSQTDKVPSGANGGNHEEDFLVGNIVERERLKQLMITVQKKVNITKRGLAALTEEEKLTLKYFYINNESRHVEKLTEKLRIERAGIYRLKDRALRKFTLNMYGLPEY